MASLPQNQLVNVATMAMSELGSLQNSYAFISIANKLFDDFQSKIVSNLGTTVQMQLPPRMLSTNGLSPLLQGIEQRVTNLTVDQASSCNFEVTDQQKLFNLKTDEYMNMFGDAAVEELGAHVEGIWAKNVNSSVPVQIGDFSNPTVTGAYHSESGPYRFYGDGVTAINSYGQLADMLANFKDFGSVNRGMTMVLPMTKIPTIINNGLQQFVLDRNEQAAESWEIASFGTPAVEVLQSNLLPKQIAGTIGNSTSPNNVLTVTGVVQDSSGAVTAIQCSTPVTTDSNAIAYGDVMVFVDNTPGFDNMRFLTFRGHFVCNQPVQFRSTAKCASTGGVVTVPIYPALQANSVAAQNINQAIQVGMKIQVKPSHQCGVLFSGNSFFGAMPKLPSTDPFESAVVTDKETGASMRMYYGYLVDQSTNGFFRNVIHGSLMVPDYSMRILFPL